MSRPVTAPDTPAIVERLQLAIDEGAGLLAEECRDTIEALLDAAVEARRLCGQVRCDLASAHAEICKLEKLDPETHLWPAWTPQANTLRWIADELEPQFDAAIAKARGQ